MVAPNCIFGGSSIQYNQLVKLAGDYSVYGGTSTNPMTWNEFVTVCNAYTLPLIDPATGVCLAPLKIGGTDPVFIDAELFTLKYPKHATEANNVSKLHVDPDTIGLKIDAQASDVVKLRNATITGESSYLFEFDSGTSASATYDFSGLTVIGAKVTLRANAPIGSMSFVSCTSFAQNDCAITSCAFNNTKITSDNLADISSSSFTSSGTGHAIEITATGTYTFTGNTFTGYAGTDGSTGNECIYNNSGGAVTINVSGGGDTPTIRNGAGASTTVNNSITLTLAGLQAGSDIVILNAGTSTERVNVDANAGTTYDYAYSVASEDIDIGVFKAGYVPFYIRSYTLGSSNSSLPVSQVVDRNYVP
jgi:hypothetical protein